MLVDHQDETRTTVGYVDADDNMYCAPCWMGVAVQPVRLLITETGDCRDVFRIIDNCIRCGTKIDYEDTRDLV
jgi:hypothetical protein